MSPVEMAFDENGKIYVAEMMDYPEDPPPGKPARSRIRLLEDTNGDGKIDRATDLRRSRAGRERIHAVEGRPDCHQRSRHSVPERHERGRQGRLAHGPLYRLFQGQPGGSHHQPAARRRQLDLLLQQRLRWPHHFPAASRDAAAIGSWRGFPFRPDQREGRGDLRSSSVRFHARRVRASLHHPEHHAHPPRRHADEIPRAGAPAGGSSNGAGHLRSRPPLRAYVPAHRAAGMAEAADRASPAAL